MLSTAVIASSGSSVKAAWASSMRAHDERLGRPVAIKRIRADVGDGQQRERLWREARAAASINHPNVCQLYEVSEDGDGLFLAMELLEGEPLNSRLNKGPLTQNEASQIGSGAVLSALAALHQKAIVHRDLETVECVSRTTASSCSTSGWPVPLRDGTPGRKRSHDARHAARDAAAICRRSRSRAAYWMPEPISRPRHRAVRNGGGTAAVQRRVGGRDRARHRARRTAGARRVVGSRRARSHHPSVAAQTGRRSLSDRGGLRTGSPRGAARDRFSRCHAGAADDASGRAPVPRPATGSVGSTFLLSAWRTRSARHCRDCRHSSFAPRAPQRASRATCRTLLRWPARWTWSSCSARC